MRRWLGLPVSIGIGPTQSSGESRQPDRQETACTGRVVALLEQERQTEALADLKTADLGHRWRWSAKLEALGIDTALRLREADPPWLRSVFGVVMERIVYELRGTPCLALEEVAPPKQQIIASRSFGKPVTALDELKQAVAFHVTRAAVKLRRQGSEARASRSSFHQPVRAGRPAISPHRHPRTTRADRRHRSPDRPGDARPGDDLPGGLSL